MIDTTPFSRPAGAASTRQPTTLPGPCIAAARSDWRRATEPLAIERPGPNQVATQQRGTYDTPKVARDMEPSPLGDVTTVIDVLLHGESFEPCLPRPPQSRPSSLLVQAGIPFAGGPS